MNSQILDDISSHCTENDAWVTCNGEVFDVSKFLESHPGGKELILQYAGQDITHVLESEDIHKHSTAAYSLLQTFRIGSFKKQNDDNKKPNMSGWKEETVDWNQGLVCQVHKFGHDYIKWVHSPVDRPLRLFQSNFLEFFSKTKWYWVPMVWLPVIAFFLVVSFNNIHQLLLSQSMSLLRKLLPVLMVLLVCFGIFLWTLVEYVLHRCLFHLTPPGDSPFWITLHFFLHGQHHKAPFDEGRLVFPPVAAMVFALPFYIFFIHALPLGIAQGLFGGGLLGYLIYDMTHYYLHHGQPSKGSYFHMLKQYHVQHHFVNQNKGYGISSKFWDMPFGTSPTGKEKKN